MRVSGWSKDDYKLLRRLARTHTQAEAATVLGRTVSAVNHAAGRVGVSFAKLGEAHSSSRWPAATVAEAVRLRGQGLTVREVGAALGVSHNTVYGWLSGDTRWVDSSGVG